MKQSEKGGFFRKPVILWRINLNGFTVLSDIYINVSYLAGM